MSSNHYQKEDLIFLEYMNNSKTKESVIANNYKKETPIQALSLDKQDKLFEDYIGQPDFFILEKDKQENFSKKTSNHIKTSVPYIDVHGKNKSEALHLAQEFLYNIPSHIKKVRIIHGKGLSTGKHSVIRQEIRSWLKYKQELGKLVKDFSYETPKNGGHGATVVWIKHKK